jgi:cation-transporting ATPase 13A3/4/5
MSVVCEMSDGKMIMFTKGSPEIMLSIMNPSSVPQDYKQKLKEYASSGFRILAIANKILEKEELAKWKTA